MGGGGVGGALAVNRRMFPLSMVPGHHMTNLWEKIPLMLGVTLSCPQDLHLSSWRPTSRPLRFQSPRNYGKPPGMSQGGSCWRGTLHGRWVARVLWGGNRRAWEAWEWRAGGAGLEGQGRNGGETTRLLGEEATRILPEWA